MEDSCSICCEVPKKTDQIINCSFCQKPSHSACLKITKSTLSLLLERKNVHWFCDRCEKKVSTVFKNVESLKTKVDCLENMAAQSEPKLDEFRKEVESLNNKINHLSKQLQALTSGVQKLEGYVEDEVKKSKKSWSDVGKTVENELSSVKKEIINVEKNIENKESLAVERELRKNNIIIFGVEEHENLENQRQADLKLCSDLFKLMLDDSAKSTLIKRMIRIGRKKEGINRPILMQFTEYSTKNLFMESLFKLKNSKFEKLSISHDMTKQDRATQKEMVKDAREKQENHQGEFKFRVRGLPGYWEIVKFPVKKESKKTEQ